MLFALAIFLAMTSCAYASSKSVSDIVKEANASARVYQQDAKHLIDQVKKNAASHDATKLVRGVQTAANGFLQEDATVKSSQAYVLKNEKKSFNGFGMPFVEVPSQGCASCQVTKQETDTRVPQEATKQEISNVLPSQKERQDGPADEYIVCVSFSLPPESLKALLDQASSRNIRVVAKGLIDNSWMKTTKRMREIGFPLDIDPEVFEKYAVTHVPTFIKVTPNGFHKLQGNVTLPFALKKLDGAL